LNKHLFGLAALATITMATAMGFALPANADETVAQTPASPAASPAPSPSPSAAPAPNAFQYGGYADLGYTSAKFATQSGLHAGTTGASTGNLIVGGPALVPVYVFNTLNRQVQFNQFNLHASYSGPIGGTVTATVGDDSNIINSYPKNQLDVPFTAGPEIDITQAFVSFTKGRFTAMVGKYVTLAGAEVIDTTADYNYSHSILFGYAIPFTHTGGRLTWSPNAYLSLIAGLNKGWDTTRTLTSPSNGSPAFNDSNALTTEVGLQLNPSKVLTFAAQGYSGQVEEGSAVAFGNPFVVTPARPTRSVIDVVATYHVNPALTLTVNGDTGSQTNSNIVNGQGTVVGYGKGTWSGVAGYANYAFNSRFSATARLEYMADYGGVKFGQSQRWAEATGTLAYAPNPNLIIRGEVRGDRTGQLFFIGPASNSYYTNRQFSVQTIVKWP
jgi:hypothetical protein